ncbi:MAG: hypothetical protein GC172_02405 [Phycisphaera sp.]|nr:hypothetical protein [Phycisphaera sp.]
MTHASSRSTASRALGAFLALGALVASAVLPAGCASAPRAGEVDAAVLEASPLLGSWTSELDGATLALEPTGLFSIDVPARGTAPARAVVGRWMVSEDGAAGERATATFTNLAGSAACAEIPGSYTFEVVRDTVRFTKVKDDCAAREEHMAWPWKRTKAE